MQTSRKSLCPRLNLQQIPNQVDKLQEAIQAAYEKNVTCYNISRSDSISGPAPDLNLSITNKVLLVVISETVLMLRKLYTVKRRVFVVLQLEM